MTRKLSVNIPAPEGSVFGPDVAEGFVGQHFHLLINGQAYLARVESAQSLGPEAINIVGVVEDPEEEQIPEPLELTTEEAVAALNYERAIGNPVNVTEDGITYPCLPIACDNDVRHLPGCVFAGGGTDGEEAPQVEAP